MSTGKPKKSKPLQSNTPWLRFTGMAVQMAAIILVGVYLGQKTDQWLAWKFPIGILLFTVGSVFLSMFYMIKQVLKK